MASKNASKSKRAKPPRPRRSGKTGLPAGSLVYLGERKTEHAAITLIEYSPDELKETRFESLADCHSCAPLLPKVWLNVHGLHEPEVMAEIGRRFKLHPLVLEDILNTDQRPKVDDYGDYLFLVARFFDHDEANLTVTSEQVSFVIGHDFVLTFQERPTGRFDPVREWLRADKGRIRSLGCDYLAYALLDLVVDRYFTVLEQVGERSEDLEDALMAKPDAALLQTLHQLKRETLTLRRAIWPLREVINTLVRNEGRFFAPETQLYLRDIYDHTVHLIESLEAIRDLIAGMLDIYLSSISNRVNQEVRTLTVFAIIFMPATLISGIFGMNFKAMPLLDAGNGFLIAIGLMIGVASTLGLIFWRRRWIG
ncbi:magnesium/cobalt transporter CorA [Sulfurisoma sediminicola]|uniref:Magnesium transport protein CorA n=1 Tax=Sulfurisoma sediminicola TaxID=1381557 RepID=A0A497XK05_9PROT|nr:magnesium/cobalt transporter CorA [Sulfurisoma sediminicola]RLJ67596.1 magnesium transporter [Sulfurisoma sediminicola]